MHQMTIQGALAPDAVVIEALRNRCVLPCRTVSHRVAPRIISYRQREMFSHLSFLSFGCFDAHVGSSLRLNITLRMDGCRVEQADCERGFVLDGFPRTREQCEQFDAMIESEGTKIWMVLQLEVSNKQVLTERLCGRWVHPVSRRSYHVQYNPPKSFVAAGGYGKATPSVETMLDDDDGTPLMQRLDNTPEAVATALAEYETKSAEVVAYYEKQCDYDVVSKSSESLHELQNSPRSHVKEVVAQAQARRVLVRVDGDGDLETVSARVWNQIH